MKTLHQYRGYVFSIEFTGEHPEWSVDFPDFQDIITAGSTLSEAFENACEALDLHLESIQKLNQVLPIPTHKLAMVG
jgi:predicted RNase H-like HicB family nuclease